ncbi:hypothetical protein C1X65_18610 [Pseudomonas sp. FW305-70]|nr:hypothetical protein C1X65_18610 [Pseudomonas sp. FW305-70]
MLAMEVNDDAGSLTPRGALRFFASKLAPTDISLSMFLVHGRTLSTHPLIRRGAGQHARSRTCRSSPRHKINFDIIGALDEYSCIACDIVECDSKQNNPCRLEIQP